ncbi:MAG: helix-turn-helix domain-containing protein [Bacteroidota bacterium]
MPVLFLFAGLGVVNGFLVGIHLLFKSPRNIIDIYFGGLILALSVRIGKSVFFYFYPDVDFLILQIGLSACVFIGPLFLLYAKALHEQPTQFSKNDLLMLSVLLLSIVTIGLIFPYRSFPEIWNTYIVRSIYLVWSGFMICGLYHSRKTLIKSVTSFGNLNERERYSLAVIIAVLFITGTYQFAFFITGFTYIWGSIIFTLSFYYLAYRALVSKKSVAPKPLKPLIIENSKDILNNIDRIMEVEKPFSNKKLKLEDLAAYAQISKHVLSKVLNDEYGHGFSHYVKTFRVNEAKQLIEFRHDLSLEGIGYESGFNSKSSFFEAFKKVTGNTPAEYKRSLEPASD